MRAVEIFNPRIWSSPLQQYRGRLQQRMFESSEPPVELKTSPFQSSPIRDMNAAAQANLQAGHFAGTRVPPALKSQPTPGYSRGTYVLHEGPGLQVYEDLGPMMWTHVTRQATVGSHLDVYA